MTRFENALRLAKSNTAFDGGSIGTLGEKTLHSVLKYYIEPCDDFHEVAVGRYVADIMRDGCITEIQTRGFDTMRAKLGAFLKEHPVTVVHPIPAVREYYTVDQATGETSAKRKSPKKGNVYDVFPELYKIKMLLGNANLYFHFILVDVTEYRCTTEKSRRNRKGIMRIDRIPTRIAEEVCIDEPADFKKLIPAGLPTPFTSKDFAKAIKRTRGHASTALNVLLAVGAVERIGKDKNAYLYKITNKDE